MFKTLAQAFKLKDVRNKILLTLVLLFIYRLGCWLPIPGIDTEVLKTNVASNQFLTLLSSVSGGALSQGAFLALGVYYEYSIYHVSRSLLYGCRRWKQNASRNLD